MDFEEMLDHAIDDGPAHRPMDDRLGAGRALVRRQRLQVGAAVLATFAVTGAAAAAFSGGGAERGAGPGIAATPTPPAVSHAPTDKSPSGRGSTALTSHLLDPEDYSLAPEGQLTPVIDPADAPVRFDRNGRLVAKDGYAIGATVDHPVVSARFVPPDADAEAALAVDGKDKWFVLAWRAPDGTSDIITEPAGLRPGPAAFLPGWPRAVAQAQDSGTGVR